VLAYVAAAVLMALMVLTCVDVGGRYFFNRPVWGAFELTEMMLAALIFAGCRSFRCATTMSLFASPAPPISHGARRWA
jgi:TRAP-type mannitol/chloroaromatic compound transport system permease small subunit